MNPNREGSLPSIHDEGPLVDASFVAVEGSLVL